MHPANPDPSTPADPAVTYGETPGGNPQPPYRGPGDDELPVDPDAPVAASADWPER